MSAWGRPSDARAADPAIGRWRPGRAAGAAVRVPADAARPAYRGGAIWRCLKDETAARLRGSGDSSRPTCRRRASSSRTKRAVATVANARLQWSFASLSRAVSGSRSLGRPRRFVRRRSERPKTRGRQGPRSSAARRHRPAGAVGRRAACRGRTGGHGLALEAGGKASCPPTWRRAACALRAIAPTARRASSRWIPLRYRPAHRRRRDELDRRGRRRGGGPVQRPDLATSRCGRRQATPPPATANSLSAGDPVRQRVGEMATEGAATTVPSASKRRPRAAARPACRRRAWPDLAHSRRNCRAGTRDLDRGARLAAGPFGSRRLGALRPRRLTGRRLRRRWTPPSLALFGGAGWAASAGAACTFRRQPICARSRPGLRGHHHAGGRRRRISLAAVDKRLPALGAVTLASDLGLGADGKITVRSLDIGSALASVKGGGSYLPANQAGDAKVNGDAAEPCAALGPRRRCARGQFDRRPHREQRSRRPQACDGGAR